MAHLGVHARALGVQAQGLADQILRVDGIVLGKQEVRVAVDRLEPARLGAEGRLILERGRIYVADLLVAVRQVQVQDGMVGVYLDAPVQGLDRLGVVPLQAVDGAEVVVGEHVVLVLGDDHLEAVDCARILLHLLVGEPQVVEKLDVVLIDDDALLQDGHGVAVTLELAVYRTEAVHRHQVLVVYGQDLLVDGQGILVPPGLLVQAAELPQQLYVLRLLFQEGLEKVLRKREVTGQDSGLRPAQGQFGNCIRHLFSPCYSEDLFKGRAYTSLESTPIIFSFSFE